MPKQAISKDSLNKIKNEIKMAEKFNECELEPTIREGILRYTGNFTPSFGSNWDIVLNEIYPIIQFYLPNLFFRNPKAYLKPRHKTHVAKVRNPVTGQKEEIILDSTKSAKTQEAVLNYVIDQIGYKEEARKVLMDALLFPFGVLWHGYKGNFGMTEEQSFYIQDESIFVKRISPLRFIWDPTVSIQNIDEARWVGRVIDVPLDDLLEDDKLDVDKKQLKGDQGFGDKLGRPYSGQANGGQDNMPLTGSAPKPMLDFTNKEYQSSTHCRFVRVQEIYLRPTAKERREGQTGTILLLTEEQEKPLRSSTWSVQAEGFPVQILEFNPVPEQHVGMPDINVYKSIADQKNIITNLQIRNAQENSKVWVALAKGEMESEEDIDKIQQGDQTIILFPSDTVSGKMQLASPSGMASSELYLIDQRIQKNLDEKSGVSELKKGFLQSGEESATSVQIRNAGSSARPQYRQDLMRDFLRRSFTYINQLEKQYFTIQDVVRIVGSLDIQWSEKPTREDNQAQVDIEIDAISMLPEDPQKEIVELREVLALMVQGIQDPAIREKILSEGKMVNLSPIIEQLLYRLKLRNPEVFRSIEPQDMERTVKATQLTEARANIAALMQGQAPPAPPTEEDDHIAKIETYSSIGQLLNAMGVQIQGLEQLIQIQQALLQKKNEEEGKPGTKVTTSKPSQPSMRTI